MASGLTGPALTDRIQRIRDRSRTLVDVLNDLRDDANSFRNNTLNTGDIQDLANQQVAYNWLLNVDLETTLTRISDFCDQNLRDLEVIAG